MIRISRHRVLTCLVAAPIAALFAAGCGGEDTIGDGTVTDAAASDGASNDGASNDGASNDGTAPTNDGASNDGATADGTARDAGDAGKLFDAQLPDGSLNTTLLGSSAKFAVFSGATVSNATGTITTINGDLGTYPDNTAIGSTPPVITGAQHLGDGVAAAAATDIRIAYDKLIPGNLPCGTNLTGLDLGGMTLTPGVYCFSSTAGMTGTLTLDAQNNPKAAWVFQVGSALTTAVGSKVVVINGAAAQVCNAFWQVSSAVTLGTNTAFGGTMLASSAVTLNTGASLVGRAFGVTAKVALDTNVISNASCL